MPVNVVCINCGDKHPDIYVDRMYTMTKRRLSSPFTFTCFTDRPRPLLPEIIQHDCSGWNLPGWYNKIKLFDSATAPHETMLFMDISMVLKDSLDPFVAFAQGKDLVAMRDWHYDCFGSCTMWIRKSELTDTIWNEYKLGKKYPVAVHGDQDYIDAILRDKGLEDKVDYYPQLWFASYKNLMNIHRSDPVEAHRLLDAAKIVKFHGYPRPHMLLNPWLNLWHVSRRFPLSAIPDFGYLRNEVREWWQ